MTPKQASAALKYEKLLGDAEEGSGQGFKEGEEEEREGKKFDELRQVFLPRVTHTINLSLILRQVCCLKPSWIPGILWVSDLIWCFGSGMTVKFFPIFFLNEEQGVGLSPTIVNLIFVINPVLISIGASLTLTLTLTLTITLTLTLTLILIVIGTSLAQRVSRCIGRVQTDILFWIFGISNLALLGGSGYWAG